MSLPLTKKVKLIIGEKKKLKNNQNQKKKLLKNQNLNTYIFYFAWTKKIFKQQH